MKLRKLLALLLVLVLVLTAFAACTTPDNPNPDKPGNDDPVEDPNAYKGAMVDNGNTYADPTWLPVVKNPITLTAMVRDELLPNRSLATLTLWDEVAATTGVKFNVELLADQPAEALLFASRNYPDVAFRLYDANLIQNAALGGDIIEITDEMLESYAPNWTNLFEQYPELYNGSKKKDGKLYSLPNMLMEEHTYELRDMYAINATYLDELGLDMPETIDDFTEYLRAVKNGAGTGSIPADVSPLYIRLNRVNIGGYYSILDWFGLYNGLEYEIVVDGKVTHNALDEQLKAATNYIVSLKDEGLLNDGAMSGDWTKYNDMMKDGSAGVGSYFAYSISDAHADAGFVAMAPMAVEGAETYVRPFGFEERLLPNSFMIFANCKNPIAALRTVDTYAAGENAIRWQIGEKGEAQDSQAQWYIKEDGTYCYTDVAWLSDGTYDTKKVGINNYVASALTADIIAQLNQNYNTLETSRPYAYENIYKDYEPADRSLYPKSALNFLSDDEYQEVQTLKTAVNKVISGRMTAYFNGKLVVADDWDDFQQALKDNGIERMHELMQKAYDAYIA